MSPSRALRVCAEPLCSVLVANRPRCPAHTRQKAVEYDAARGTPAQRGYGPKHRAWREVILKRDPICKMCRKEPSTVADHIVPLRQGGTWSYSNGQGLCETDHNRKRQRESVEARKGR